MSNQPTATQFTRKEESWAEFLAGKTAEKIEALEAEMRADGVPEENFSDNPTLLDLYDDEMFYQRLAEFMREKRVYIRERYLMEEHE